VRPPSEKTASRANDAVIGTPPVVDVKVGRFAPSVYVGCLETEMEARGYRFGYATPNKMRFRYAAEGVEPERQYGDDFRDRIRHKAKREPSGEARRDTSHHVPDLERDETLVGTGRGLDGTIPSGSCRIWITDRRIIWQLDKSPDLSLDVRFEDFQGIGINYETRLLAAEVSWKPFAVGEHVVTHQHSLSTSRWGSTKLQGWTTHPPS
jgi:hypothetical protein